MVGCVMNLIQVWELRVDVNPIYIYNGKDMHMAPFVLFSRSRHAMPRHAMRPRTRRLGGVELWLRRCQPMRPVGGGWC